MADTYLSRMAARDVVALEGLARWHSSLPEGLQLDHAERCRIVVHAETVVIRLPAGVERDDLIGRVAAAADALGVGNLRV